MIQINDPLFQESFHFIRNNPYATTDILPSKLLSLWSADDSGNDSLPFQAFMTAFLAFNVRKTGETKFNIDMDRLQSMYATFRNILALEVLKRKGLLEVEALRIFDFDDYDTSIQVIIKSANVTNFINKMN